MANLAASDITVTINTRRRNNGRNFFNVTLAFGDGVKTYPAGGVPITIGNVGCPNIVESCDVYDAGNTGLNWSYDTTNKKLVASQSPAHTHNLLLKNAAVADGATTRVNAGANLLGANTGADLTVTGSGANGGVVAVAAGVLSEPSTVAIAAQTLKCEIIGW